MRTSRRLQRLGSGVFDRSDQRKQRYRTQAVALERPLVDLSLGSTDLDPPPRCWPRWLRPSTDLEVPPTAFTPEPAPSGMPCRPGVPGGLR